MPSTAGICINRNRLEVPLETSTFVFMDARESHSSAGSSSPIETRLAQRKFQRIPVELHCLFSPDGGEERSGTAIDLSPEGCAIQSTALVHKGDYLRVLLFPSANRKPIEVDVAPVRWSANGQFGVEFITLTPGDSAQLQGLLTIVGG